MVRFTDFTLPCLFRVGQTVIVLFHVLFFLLHLVETAVSAAPHQCYIQCWLVGLPLTKRVACFSPHCFSRRLTDRSFPPTYILYCIPWYIYQIPLAEVYNDARRNVVVAMIIAGSQRVPEVCIFFCDRLLRANRAVKVDR